MGYVYQDLIIHMYVSVNLIMLELIVRHIIHVNFCHVKIMVNLFSEKKFQWFKLILGTCVVTNGTAYQCICPAGLTGSNCLTPLNPCGSLPCQNNGQCISLGNQFLCVCTTGFNGTYCEAPINPCASNPCKSFVLLVYLKNFLCLFHRF